MFQDEDEGVEDDGDGASVCPQRGNDSWLDPRRNHNHHSSLETTKDLKKPPA